MSEACEFEPRESYRDGQPDRSGVLLRESDGRLRVQLVVTPWGMPHRGHRPPAVRLEPGEWVRWQINYRFAGSSGGDWSYRLDTLNLAYGAAQADVFLGSPPRLVDERGRLR